MKLENVDAMNRLKTEMKLPLSQFGAKSRNFASGKPVEKFRKPKEPEEKPGRTSNRRRV
jgi:hypothetical protein